MNNNNDYSDMSAGYECVEPRLGEELWRLGAPDQDPALLAELNLHLEICDHCRLVQATEKLVATELVPARQPAFRRQAGRFLAPAGFVALAACLVLMFMIPLVDPAAGHVHRAGGPGLRFLSPVAGQVVATATPELRWTAVEGASRYRVTLQAIDGAWSWSSESRTPHLQVPQEAALPLNSGIRAMAEPVPADLALPGSISVSFERQDWPGVVVYRAGAAPWFVQVLGLIGAVLGLGGAFLLRAGRKG